MLNETNQTAPRAREIVIVKQAGYTPPRAGARNPTALNQRSGGGIPAICSEAQ